MAQMGSSLRAPGVRDSIAPDIPKATLHAGAVFDVPAGRGSQSGEQRRQSHKQLSRWTAVWFELSSLLVGTSKDDHGSDRPRRRGRRAPRRRRSPSSDPRERYASPRRCPSVRVCVGFDTLIIPYGMGTFASFTSSGRMIRCTSEANRRSHPCGLLHLDRRASLRSPARRLGRIVTPPTATLAR